MKKLFVGVLALQFLFSCSKNEDEIIADVTPNTTNLQNAPYSSLSSEQQKLKLEDEAKTTLQEFEKTKTSSTIEAIRNLDFLLKSNPIDLSNGKLENGLNEILNLSDAYGIYTWNNTMKRWDKTLSNENLVFKFPSKKIGTTNDTELIATSVSSKIKIKIIDTPIKYQWVYNTNGYPQQMVITPEVFDNLYLPLSVEAKIKINNVETGTISLKNTFGTINEVPLTSSFKLNVNDGYTLEINTNKQDKSTASAKLSYNGKNILSFDANSTAQIDKLLDGQNLTSYYGKANAMYSIMDNFVILGDVDNESLKNEQNKIRQDLPYPNYSSSDYYKNLNIYNKTKSQLLENASNKHIKLALVSKKDKTKIADIVWKSDFKRSTFHPVIWENGLWQPSNTKGEKVDYYNEVMYLKFNDTTLVAMNVYFSTGFDSLKTEIKNFINVFN
ncbi:hypothetical protein [Flavobacterium oreochromis]|uniref:hypothetical protein n=1 Tax=Flavobacterium oreochromis TaxID=2906078 RepID=UPI00385BE924